MSWAADPYAEALWGATVVPNTAPPGQTIPPPIPGGTAEYVGDQQPGAMPWAYGGWAGAVAPTAYFPGGIVVAPDADAGVVQVFCWWPDAKDLLLMRITADGTRTPVRGAYPLTTNTATRDNLCQNPSVEGGLNGYVPGTGNPTLSTITRTDLETANLAWRAKITSAGTDEVAVPVALAPGPAITIALDLRFSARPTGVTITLGWNRSDGTALTPSTAALTANEINASVGQFGRQLVLLSAPTDAFECSTLKIAATGLPAGATMDGDRCMVELDASDGSYADGDSLGGTWTGVAELSTSLIAPVLTVLDGECPLDIPVIYQAYHPAIIGASVAAPPVILPSNGRSWLTHPSSPAAPIQIWPTVTPPRTYALQQAINPVIGRPRPVVVSASTRTAAASSLTLDCATFAGRAQLLALLKDGQPVLLRAPALFGYEAEWIAFGDVGEDPGGRPAPVQTRTVSGNYQVVDPPAAANLLVTS